MTAKMHEQRNRVARGIAAHHIADSHSPPSAPHVPRPASNTALIGAQRAIDGPRGVSGSVMSRRGNPQAGSIGRLGVSDAAIAGKLSDGRTGAAELADRAVDAGAQPGAIR
jgi:hypothetical protein